MYRWDVPISKHAVDQSTPLRLAPDLAPLEFGVQINVAITNAGDNCPDIGVCRNQAHVIGYRQLFSGTQQERAPRNGETRGQYLIGIDRAMFRSVASDVSAEIDPFELDGVTLRF